METLLVLPKSKSISALVIDPGRLGAEVRFEDAGAGEAYPHIYGPVPLSAIERVFALPLGSDGRVVLPEGF